MKEIENASREISPLKLKEQDYINKFFSLDNSNDKQNSDLAKKLQFLLERPEKPKRLDTPDNYQYEKPMKNIILRNRSDRLVVREFNNIYDGYNLRFGFKPEENVNLYLGDSGYNNKILWIDSQSNKKIKAVFNNFREIRQLDKFKNIDTIQFPEPENITEFPRYEKLENRYTKDYKPIYEKRVISKYNHGAYGWVESVDLY